MRRSGRSRWAEYAGKLAAVEDGKALDGKGTSIGTTPQTGNADPKPIAGEVSGVAFKAADAVISTSEPSKASSSRTSDFTVIVSTHADACHNGQDALPDLGEARVWLTMSAPADGAAALTLPVEDGSSTGRGVVAVLKYVSQACDRQVAVGASEGNVRVDLLSPDAVDGEVDLRFPTGRLSGTFHARRCVTITARDGGVCSE